MATKRIAWCLWLILLMPSMAFSAERRVGAYYCTVKFAGGIAYNNTLVQWEGTIFRPEGNFVMKLAGTTDRDEYDVTITDEGEQTTRSSCLADAKPPSIDQFAFMSCSRANGIYEYKFNFDNTRFIRIYKAGYTNGVDNNTDTPAISGGFCTKIQ